VKSRPQNSVGPRSGAHSWRGPRPKAPAAWRQLVEFRRASELARGRVGPSAENRLRWAVTFSQFDLGVLRPGEREALGYDLRALIPRNYAYGLTAQALPEKEVRRLQDKFREAIQTVLGKPNHPLRLQLGSPALVRARIARDGPYRLQLAWETKDEADAIFGGFVGLLLDPEYRLRSCAECKAPFVVSKRQKYCSAACSQRTRNRRKQKRKEEE
jgi:hypothetical protein